MRSRPSPAPTASGAQTASRPGSRSAPHPPAPAACREVLNYASYLVELALPDYGMLKYPYSMLAAAAVYAANLTLGRWVHICAFGRGPRALLSFPACCVCPIPPPVPTPATPPPWPRRTPYSNTLQRHAGYSEEAIRDCAVALANLHRKAPNNSLQAGERRRGRGTAAGRLRTGCPADTAIAIPAPARLGLPF